MYEYFTAVLQLHIFFTMMFMEFILKACIYERKRKFDKYATVSGKRCDMRFKL